MNYKEKLPEKKIHGRVFLVTNAEVEDDISSVETLVEIKDLRSEYSIRPEQVLTAEGLKPAVYLIQNKAPIFTDKGKVLGMAIQETKVEVIPEHYTDLSLVLQLNQQRGIQQ